MWQEWGRAGGGAPPIHPSNDVARTHGALVLCEAPRNNADDLREIADVQAESVWPASHGGKYELQRLL